MFKKVLVANRGEIAVRIIRSLKEMGIKTVAIYSTADRENLHVQLADEAVCVGGPQPTDSYLNIKNILSAAIGTGAQAIHPGYGFLSENAEFAQMCEDCGLIFIGPKSKMIDQMGNKEHARQLMMAHGVPVTPGSKDFIKDADEAKKIAAKVGYPVLLKAAAGGGGKGIRQVADPSQMATALASAQSEAKNDFGDDRMYLEKVMQNVKHIEVQIFRDAFGHAVYFPERDCSLQRNKQKSFGRKSM
jgi:Acetyl/propionyl-CoA carboxylase, alpha subunit